MSDAMNEVKLLCPKCSYELGAMREDEGVCPECGLGYSKRAMRARRDAAVSVGLAMMGWGMVGAVGVGFLDAWRLSFLPALAAAAGVAVLAGETGTSVWKRKWPVAVALVYGAVSLFALSWSDENGTPVEWLGRSGLLNMLLSALLAIAGAATLARATWSSLGLRTLTVWCIVAGLALLGLISRASRMVHAVVVDRDEVYAMFGIGPELQRWDSLDLVFRLTAWLATEACWMLVGLAAVVAWAVGWGARARLRGGWSSRV